MSQKFAIRLALVAMVTKIWDSTSNNEIIVWFMAKGFDRHRVQQNIAHLVIIILFNQSINQSINQSVNFYSGLSD